MPQVPVLAAALNLARQGYGPGAIERNWASYGSEVSLDPALPAWAQRLLCDPQTSGGLLVTCAPELTGAVLERFQADGFDQAAIIGDLVVGAAGVRVR